MDNSITVTEHTHGIWNKLTFICGGLCLVFFIAFWNMEDPLWTGIFRFTSFIFFAVTVLIILKWMGGPLKAQLSAENQKLLVGYRKKNELIHEEQFDLSTITEITAGKEGKDFISSMLAPKVRSFKVHFSDTERELYLFEFSGRPLLFDSSNTRKLSRFLDRHRISHTFNQA